jgi:hypothetical protein
MQPVSWTAECASEYCTILINSTHPCDCDTLDQFDTLTQVAGDHDKAKILTPNNLNKAQIGNFGEYLHPIGCGRRLHEPKFAKQAKTSILKKISSLLALSHVGPVRHWAP